MLFEEVTVGRVHAQRLVETGFEGRRSDYAAFPVLGQPFGAARRGVMIPLNGEVNRYPDASTVAGVDLPGEQLLFQVRVPAFGEGLGVEVKPPVVAARKAGNRVYVRFRQRLGELVGVEIRTDGFDSLTGVEVEVDLTKA